MKEILLILFGLVVVAGLCVSGFRAANRLNPKTQLLIAALKCINGREDEDRGHNREGPKNAWLRSRKLKDIW